MTTTLNRSETTMASSLERVRAIYDRGAPDYDRRVRFMERLFWRERRSRVCNDLVFTNEIGEPIRQRSVHKAFKDMLAAAELPTSHRPHDLRHSMATYLVAAGVNERVVMEILGHSTLAMTQRYSHVLGPMLVDAADRLEALWTRSAIPN